VGKCALLTVAMLGGAYLVGSIPFSYLIARRWGIADVRTVGSGNVGATNVLRAAGRTAGALALVLDALKGAIASFVAMRLAPGSVLPPLVATLAILGHMYPVWLGFRGGKGVATGVGAFLPLAPAAGLGGLLAFVLVAGLSRYVSLGSVAGAAAVAGLTFVLGRPPLVSWCATAMAALIAWKHRANLRRIADRTERRLGAQRS